MNDMNNLSWSKGIFKCVYHLFKNGKPVGTLKENQWSMSAIGKIGEKSVLFRMKNGWHNHTSIVDRDNHAVIGQIKYNYWYPGAKITLGNDVYRWRFKNIWSTKWRITDSKNQEIQYSGHTCKGEAIAAIDNDLVVLSGLFVGNYYWQMLAIYLVIILLPFWMFLL